MGKSESNKSEPQWMVVDAVRQELRLWIGETLGARLPVSTSRFGLGARSGSHRTPPGWHRVAERFGQGAPPGTVFRSRKAVDLLSPAAWTQADAPDAILSRIWWLAGDEPGVNAGPGIDSHKRMIYLHGTNQEHLLGRPASIGCVRLANRAMIALDAAIDPLDSLRIWIGAAPPDTHLFDKSLPPARGEGILNL